jgi:hypothetical protein
MTFFAHQTRSVRVTIQPPDGPPIVVENLANNEGFEIDFDVARDMTPALGEVGIRIYNLPASLRAEIEAAQRRTPTDLDEILAGLGAPSGWQVFEAGIAQDGSSALAVGFPLIKLEAGFDGNLSLIAEVVGASISSRREDDTTYVTEIKAIDALDVSQYSRPITVFAPGTPTFDVLFYLRNACGLGSGNLSFPLWQALVGDSRLDDYYYSSMPGLEALAQLLDFLPIRWWIDGRDLYVLPKDGQPYPPGAPPPFVPDEPLTPDLLVEMPRVEDGGFVRVVCLLTPAALPGRLLTLSAAALGLGDLTAEEIGRAEIPPGLYRIESVGHSGTTTAEPDFDTVLMTKRVAFGS